MSRSVSPLFVLSVLVSVTQPHRGGAFALVINMHIPPETHAPLKHCPFVSVGLTVAQSARQPQTPKTSTHTNPAKPHKPDVHGGDVISSQAKVDGVEVWNCVVVDVLVRDTDDMVDEDEDEDDEDEDEDDVDADVDVDVDVDADVDVDVCGDADVDNEDGDVDIEGGFVVADAVDDNVEDPVKLTVVVVVGAVVVAAADVAVVTTEDVVIELALLIALVINDVVDVIGSVVDTTAAELVVATHLVLVLTVSPLHTQKQSKTPTTPLASALGARCPG
jgi:hypothetical protein